MYKKAGVCGCEKTIASLQMKKVEWASQKEDKNAKEGAQQRGRRNKMNKDVLAQRIDAFQTAKRRRNEFTQT